MKIPKYKNVALLQVFNELDRGNLERYFKYMRLFVDNIIVYDDFSSDGTYEYCLANADFVFRGKQNQFSKEIFHKQVLLSKVLEYQPDFIFALDTDEIFSNSASLFLNEILHECVEGNFDAISLKEINLWRSNRWRRVDSLFDDGQFVRIWRAVPEIKFEKIREGLHQRHFPTTIKKVMSSEKVSLVHFGFADELNIAFKYLNYKKHGQRGYDDLSRLIDESHLKTERVDDSILPLEFRNSRQLKPSPKTYFESLNYVYSYKKKFTRPVYSIICLIFKSTGWLNFVFEQILKYTSQKDTEIIFIANDADSDVIRYLSENYIPHVVFCNSQQQRKEWYINNVYRAWNHAGDVARGDFLVFLNSDMAFSPNWFKALTAKYDGRSVLSPLGVESGKYEAGTNGINRNFGRSYEDYDEEGFLEFAYNIKEDAIKSGGLFMPLLIRRDVFNKVGRYPEGNIVPSSNFYFPKIAEKGQSVISGDVVLIAKLKAEGISHKTICDSLIYHFQCGESENDKVSTYQRVKIAICNDKCDGSLGERVLWNYLVDYLPGAFPVDNKLLGEMNFESKAKDFIEDKNADLIIQNASFMNFIDTNKPNIVYLQDDLRSMGRASIQQEQNLKLADVIVANTFQTSVSYYEYPVEIIPVGVDHALFKPREQVPLREKHGIPSGLVGIFVGNFDEIKGWSKVKKVIEDNEDTHFIVVSKKNEKFLRKNVSSYSQISQIELCELLNCSNFFIIGSPVETQCLAAIEANLCDLPVLMPLVGIYQELSISERDNVGVFTNNLQDGIKKIKNFSGNPRKQILKKNLTIDDTMQSWRILIEKTILRNKHAILSGEKNNIQLKLTWRVQLEQIARTLIFKPIFGSRYLHLRDKFTRRYIRKLLVYMTKKFGAYEKLKKMRDYIRSN